MKNKIYYGLFWALLWLTSCCLIPSFGQTFSVENLAKAKPLQVTGGLGANGVFTSGLPDGNAPFNYFLSGYLNFSLYGVVNVPVMMNYSDRRISLSQGYNFNQISIHPSYKWATAHIGTTSMSFSPYTLNGHQFTGVGVELTPGKWKIQAMSGRLLRGQYQDSTITGPTFKRMGYGAKVEYNPGKYLVGATVLKTHDIASTVPELYRKFDGTVINPQDNLVISLNFGATLFRKLQFSGEYANSVITKDQKPEYARTKIHSLAGIFHSANATTESYNALKTKLDYNVVATNTIIGVGYERIDPNYMTLGGYYFVNDLANYTFHFSQSAYKGRLTLGGNLGVQKDDIKKTKVNRQSRFVGSLNAQGKISETMNMSFTFSNFQSYRFLNDTYSQITRVPGMIVDTLNFQLASRTLGYNLVKMLKKSEMRTSSLNFNSSLVNSQSKHGESKEGSTNILNSSLTYSMGFPKKQTTLNTTLTYFRNAMPTGTIQGVGPTVGVQNTALAKLTTTLNLSLLSVYSHMQLVPSTRSAALNVQVASAWKIDKHNMFNFNTGFVQNNGNSFLNGNLGYNYTF